MPPKSAVDEATAKYNQNVERSRSLRSPIVKRKAVQPPASDPLLGTQKPTFSNPQGLIPIFRGPTNIKPPTPAELQDMKLKQYARQRNTS